jgi:protein TonB
MGALVCLAASGCVTPHQPKTAVLPECQPVVAAPTPSPPSTKPFSIQPQPPLDAAGGFRLLDVTLDTSHLPKAVDLPGPATDPSFDPADPRFQAYFEEIKRRIQTSWVYPQEAIRRFQSGKGVVQFAVMRDGRLGPSKIVQSTGAEILDRYMLNAIRFAAPFSPHPCRVAEELIPMTLTFTYVLGRPSQ